MNKTFKPEREKNSNTSNLKTIYLADHEKIFTGGTHHEWGFVGGSMAFPNKSKMAAAAIINFGKISITPDCIKISLLFSSMWGRQQLSCPVLHQISWEDASRPCRDDHVTKSRNRKLIRVTSSNIGLKHMCVSISVTVTNIWTKFGTEHNYHTINTREWPNSHKLKIHDGGRHLEFRKNVNNFGLDKDILYQIILVDVPRPCADDHWPNVETGS